MLHSHSVFVCWQQRGPTVPPPAEMEAARAAALARLPQPPLSSHGSTILEESRVGFFLDGILRRLASEVRAQDAGGECGTTPSYLRLDLSNWISRPS